MKKLITTATLIISIVLSLSAFSSNNHKIVVTLYNNSPYTFTNAYIVYYFPKTTDVLGKLTCGKLVGNKQSTCTLQTEEAYILFSQNGGLVFSVYGSNHSSGYHFKSEGFIKIGDKRYAIIECKKPKDSKCSVNWRKEI